MSELVCELDSGASRITLGDLLLFVDWMQRADRALELGQALPAAPDVETGKVKGWVALIQKMEQRQRTVEEQRQALEANLTAQESQLTHLVSTLHQNIASLYDTLGLEDKANQLRKKVDTVFAG